MAKDTLKKRKYLPLYFLLLGAIAVLLLKPLIIFGQELLSKQGLEITPPSQEITSDPGKTVTVKVKIRNPNPEALSMKVRTEDFTASGDEGQVALVDETKYSVVGWTTLNPKSFSLKGNSTQEVTARISIPKNAAGGRYGAIVFSVIPSLNEAEKASATAVGQEVASLFLLKINGPTEEKLFLNDVIAPQFSEFGPITIKLDFENKGNIHVKTTGLVNVTNMFGRKVADIVVKPTNIFPGATRLVEAQLDKRFLFGFYSATAVMYYGSANNTLSSTTTFFVFPVRIVAALVIILFILYAGRKRLSKAGKALFG